MNRWQSGCKTDKTSEPRYGSVLVGSVEATAGIQALVELLNFSAKLRGARSLTGTWWRHQSSRTWLHRATWPDEAKRSRKGRWSSYAGGSVSEGLGRDIVGALGLEYWCSAACVFCVLGRI